jgi:hypothetical protein
LANIPAARIRTGSLTKHWFYEPFLFCAKKEKSFPVITGKLIKDNRKMSQGRMRNLFPSGTINPVQAAAGLFQSCLQRNSYNLYAAG